MAKSPQKAPISRVIQLGDIKMLSVGTGNRTYSFEPPGCNAGLAAWGPRLFEVSGTAQSQGATFQAAYLLGERFKRVDYELPDKSWHLDAVEATEKLIHLGREVAAEQLKNGVEEFFVSVAERYRPHGKSSLTMA